jgi:hypothetical protein
MTYLWKEERSLNHYRIQTDERLIYSKLIRRQGFKLTTNAINGKLWIFNCQFTRPDIAKKTIKSVTGKIGKIDSEGVIYYE